MDFDAFWAQYPRKVAKKDAHKAWTKLSTAQKNTALNVIQTHNRYWDACGTIKEHIPHPATWLNGWRFDDEIEMPQQKTKPEGSWWSSEKGILDKGASIGLVPRPGETIWQFKDRINDRLAHA